MALRFNGFTISAGVPGLFATNGQSRGAVSGLPCRIVSETGAGVSFDPFSFEIPCNCDPQPGDTIEISASTVGFFDVTRIRWVLCGGECSDSKTELGFSLGLEAKFLKWVVVEDLSIPAPAGP